ncbi:MAG: hypothetical protein LC685_03410 [Actinobacteria bacterium]|nr:hypothetical protein [Actinomycetota bacterium]
MRELLKPADPGPLALAILALAALALGVAGFEHGRLFHRGYDAVEIIGPLFILNAIDSTAAIAARRQARSAPGRRRRRRRRRIHHRAARRDRGRLLLRAHADRLRRRAQRRADRGAGGVRRRGIGSEEADGEDRGRAVDAAAAGAGGGGED